MYTPPVTPWELVGASEGRISDWGEVVTRYPYRKVGMDHLLSMEKDKNANLTNRNILLSFERLFSQK